MTRADSDMDVVDRATLCFEALCFDLSTLGLPRGQVFLIHSSLRRIGPLPAGPATLLDALWDVLGLHSTIVVPAFTAQNSTTTRRFRQLTNGMTAEKVSAEEAKIEGFDRSRTPAQDVGAFAEFIRRHRGSVRSDHPQTSFAALGPAAAQLLDDHALDCHLGERSPLARLYAADAIVLLLGVGFDVCTCFHLAEYRLATPAPRRLFRCYVQDGNERILREFIAAEVDDSDFGRLGEVMTARSFVRRGRVGRTTVCWFPFRQGVDFAVDRMSRWRVRLPTDSVQ
jgi:aminoglycoside 3-N-acetyltransferase